MGRIWKDLETIVLIYGRDDQIMWTVKAVFSNNHKCHYMGSVGLRGFLFCILYLSLIILIFHFGVLVLCLFDCVLCLPCMVCLIPKMRHGTYSMEVFIVTLHMRHNNNIWNELNRDRKIFCCYVTKAARPPDKRLSLRLSLLNSSSTLFHKWLIWLTWQI